MSETKPPAHIRFDYIKSNHFRVVRAEGVFGGVTPKGLIWATFWTERGPIPTQMVHPVAPEGTLEPEDRSRRVVRDAMIREAEVNVTLDLPTAVAFREWLDEKIKLVESGPGGRQK